MSRVIKKLRSYQADFPKRQAARQRLPWWAVLFQLTIAISGLGGLAMGWLFGFEALYHIVHPSIPLFEPRFPSGGLMAFPGIVAAIFISVILTNVVIRLVPPVRRANEEAFRGVRSGSFRESTGSLAKGAAIVVPLCIVIALIGVWEPWAL